MSDPNLLIGQEDYWAGYNASIEKLNNDPSVVEFDRLCWHVFGNSEEGKKLLKYFEDRIIFPSIPGQGTPDYQQKCMYYEGYKESIRQLIYATRNYPIRKEAEDKKKIDAASKGEQPK